MEIVFASWSLDGGIGFWNLRATVQLLCYKSSSLSRLRFRLLHRCFSASRTFCILSDIFVHNSIGYLKYRNPCMSLGP